jgi:hypothetical protein
LLIPRISSNVVIQVPRSFPEHYVIGPQLGDPMTLFPGGSDTVAAAPVFACLS